MSAIDQALHGYRDGHRLLASSRELSAADRRRIAVQSDNADSGRSGDWEALLAGYPLPSGLYAWSMTWPAPEMPRPGCVWAHTVLCDPSDLDGVEAMAILAGFRRPQGVDDLDPYTRPLELKTSSGQPAAPNGGAALLSALLWSIYEAPLRPVRVAAVPWQDRARHELMLSLWLQQWPVLRAIFSLTDAPATPRRIDEGAPYELQLHQSSRVQGREKSQRLLSGLPQAEPPKWASAAAAGLLGERGVDQFLQAYGPEAGPEREAFSGLCEIREAAGEPGVVAATAVLEQIDALFPGRDSGLDLKQDLLDPHRALAGCEREPDDFDLLLALLAIQDLSNMPTEDLDLERRLGRIAAEGPEEIGQLIAAIGEPNQVGTELLDLIGGGDSRRLRRWLGDNSDALRKLISLRPQLAGTPALWRAFGAEAWDAIAPLRGKGRRQEVIAAMIEEAAEVEPALVIEAWPEATEAVLNLAGTAPKLAALPAWLASLPSKELVNHLNAAGEGLIPAAARVMLEALAPEEMRRVQLALVEAQLQQTKALDLSAKVFVAAVLNASRRDWQGPALESFERLCGKGRTTPRALERQLDQLTDRRLDPGTWRDRASRVLNLAFQEDSWDPLETLNFSQVPFKRLIEADKKAGLARRILNAGSRDPERFKKWQRQALLENVEERADKDSLIGLVKRVLRWPLGG